MLNKTISQFTKLYDVKWGDCPLCARADVLLVKENRWHCYGCGLGGDAIDWLIYSRGMTPKQAIEELKNMKNKEQKGRRGPGRPPKVRKGD